MVCYSPYMLNNTNILDRGTVSTKISQSEVASEVASQLADPAILKAMSRAVFAAAGNTGANDDIVQDAIVSILSQADKFDWTRGNFITWACRIAGNLARNWRKASANRGHESTTTVGKDESAKIVDATDSLVGVDGQADMVRRSEAAMLALALDVLGADEQIFLTAMLDGKTQTEAGKVLGWSPATSTRRMVALTAKIRAKMAE